MNTSPAILSLDNVAKMFSVARSKQTMQALQSVSLDIYQGEFVSIVGPSGCGKSTLLNMLAGLELPTSGQLRMEGQPISGPSADRGMMFQEYALFPWSTVRENSVSVCAMDQRRAPHSKAASRDCPAVHESGRADRFRKQISARVIRRDAAALRARALVCL